MSYDTILAKSPSIIFRPGTPATGLAVPTWAEVQAYVAYREGCCIVYVDDSLAPCHVPAASGVTNFFGRGEIRPYRQDDLNFSSLIVDSGATLKGLASVSGTIWVQFDTQGATPGLDFDYTPNIVGTPEPIFYVQDSATLGMTSTATQPGCVVPANGSLVVQFQNQGGTFSDPAAPLLHLFDATASIVLNCTSAELRDATGLALVPINWITGLGTVSINYDTSTIGYSNGLVQTSAAVTHYHCNDTFERSIEFNASTNDVFAALKAAAEIAQVGTMVVRVEGFGGVGGGGGGQGGASAAGPGSGGGGSGGATYGFASFTADLSHRLDVTVGGGGAAGVAGAIGGGAGGNGGDGAPSLVTDFTTATVAVLLPGSAGGTGGAVASGAGGASIAGLGNVASTNGLPSVGGPGSLSTIAGVRGNPASIAINNPGGGSTWPGGVGGTSAVGQGGGGGGGGAGARGAGSRGGNSSAGNGGAGVDAVDNLGGGAGGGAGGTGAGNTGGAGGAGKKGWVRFTFTAPAGIPG